MTDCKIDGCTQEPVHDGYCYTHLSEITKQYQEQQAANSPLPKVKKPASVTAPSEMPKGKEPEQIDVPAPPIPELPEFIEKKDVKLEIASPPKKEKPKEDADEFIETRPMDEIEKENLQVRLKCLELSLPIVLADDITKLKYEELIGQIKTLTNDLEKIAHNE